jgi:hypothetical protein
VWVLNHANEEQTKLVHPTAKARHYCLASLLKLSYNSNHKLEATMLLSRYAMLVVLAAVPAFAQIYNAPVPPQSITSGHLSGYHVFTNTGSVTKVTGSWRVPSVGCDGVAVSNVLFFVGIDNGENLEQIGTGAVCTTIGLRY